MRFIVAGFPATPVRGQYRVFTTEWRLPLLRLLHLHGLRYYAPCPSRRHFHCRYFYSGGASAVRMPRVVNNAAVLQNPSNLNRKFYPQDNKGGWSRPSLGGFGARFCAFSPIDNSALSGQRRQYPDNLIRERTHFERKCSYVSTLNLPVPPTLCVRQLLS